MVVEGGRRKSSLLHDIDLASLLPRFGDDDSPRADIRADFWPSKLRIESLIQETEMDGRITERTILTLSSLIILLKMQAISNEMAVAVLVHTVLISSTSIEHRRQVLPAFTEDQIDQVSTSLSTFAKFSRLLLEDPRWNGICESAVLPCDIIDLVDGRLLRSVFSNVVEGSHQSLLNPDVVPLIRVLSSTLSSAAGVALNLNLDRNDIKQRISHLNINGDATSKEISILPFSNNIFDKHMGPISISIDTSKGYQGQSAKVFREVSHWHNAKKRLDLKNTHVLSDREKFFALRRDQFFKAEMTAYAASLTGTTGKNLEPELITVSDTKKLTREAESNKENEKLTAQRRGQNIKSASNQKGAKAIIAANQAAKGSVVVDKTMAAWKTVRTNLDVERQLQSRYRKTKTYLRDLSDEKKAILQGEVEMYMLSTLLKIYRILCKNNSIDSNLTEQINGIAALLFSTLRALASAQGLTVSIVDLAKSIQKALGLPDIAFPSVGIDRKLSFDVDLRLGDVKQIATAKNKFQLMHCGPYMDRNLDSAPDPRVPTFNPDGWQRKVLDELDADRSIFVVAPTSAGKTFISFYAMEKILRRNDDSVLVYVAPTKALVNQIAAEIQGRFKKLYKHAGKSVWAIHTRDYRINNPSGCQILVTVPHILQIMLLSPSNAKTWSIKVKRIIFDEIHSIGQAEDGVVWEQLLLLAPCPIIALSATVGNPDQFNSWLTSTQRSSGFDLTMITHPHRYSDLRKFVYSPPKRFQFNGLPDPAFATLGLDGLAGLTFVHPVASLVNKSRGMPKDLSLEARDCFTLWKSMSRHQSTQYPVDDSLDPSRLPEIIRKAHIIDWEEKLKALLKAWMVQESSPFDKVVEELGKPLEESKGAEFQCSRPEDSSVVTEAAEVDPDNLFQTTLPLLSTLQQRGALPAIFFNYDRYKCETICQVVVKQLETAEALWKENSPAWKAKLKGFEQYQKNKTKLAAKKGPKAPANAKKKGKPDEDDPASKADRIQDAASEEADPYASFSPDAPIGGFHFADKSKVEASELEDIFRQLNRRKLPQWLMDTLLRGIGVHHAGMNRKYRQAVEMLFRKGFLRVVIATGTLALGINMPCATVVFSGDSVFLTALNYRQAAGRAGRRGFDLLGNVVFQNLRTAKVCRLLSSRLPDLNGHFPVTTTLVLRLFTLLHESGSSKYAVDAINSLLSQPRLYLDGPAFKDQVLHHLRFSIEYLRRNDLLSSQGVPLNFAGLTSHLYFTENSSFALNVLLKEGYFHELCSDIDIKESSVLSTLMIVMAHLFGRRPCRQSDQEYIEKVVKRSPSIVFLPPLPLSASRILQQHNHDTLQIFTTYVRTFVDQHIHTPDHTLPLTGVSVGGTNPAPPSLPTIPPTKVRSPFVALSGHSDTFTSISDLCRTTRSGVFLEEAVIPHLDVYPDETATPLNAYLYDFYMHGDVDALERANGVRKSDVWFLLNDFSLVLATLQTSLANFLKLPGVDVDMADLVGEGDQNLNKEEDTFIAAEGTDSGYASGSNASSFKDAALTSNPSTSTSSAATAGAAGKKKKVEDSWEDEADGLEASEAAAEAAAKEEEEWVAEGPQTVHELEQGFLRIFKAVSLLKKTFDAKFHAMFA